MGPGNVLIYLLAGALCALYTADTLLVAYNYRYHSINPPSSKLLFYAEALKLLLASCFFFSERGNAGYNMYQHLSDPDLRSHNGKLKLAPDQPWHVRGADSVRTWLMGMAVFSVPAACYFTTNNLCFWALQIMPPHTYTLLSDLKIITTGVLSYLMLNRQLNKRAAASLVLLFTGICLGQYGTSTDSSSTAASSTAAAGPLGWVHGVLVMSLVAVLSAVAAVYTEWVMNFSATYKHESINLQNMRLYASGTLFNGLYSIMRTQQSSLSSLEDMRPTHLLIVMGLAFMGLVTSLVIKRYGNIVKIYASCVASLVAAGASSFLLHDGPSWVFYVGCSLTLIATLQFQKARNEVSTAAADKLGTQQPGSPNGKAGWKKAVGVPAICALVLVLMLASRATVPSTGSIGPQADKAGKLLAEVSPAVKAPGAANTGGTSSQLSLSQGLTPLVLTASQLGPTTAAPMMPLPPYPPTCINNTLDAVYKAVCPILDCRTDGDCTVHDPSCCAYLNYQMLTFLDRFLKSKCLQDEYILAHGTALGAVRDKTILPHTHDVDIAVTPLVIQFLELNSTREELWRHGYALFYYDEFQGWWKLCPHKHHPAHELKSAFRALGETVKGWQDRTNRTQAVYLDLWPMWPVVEGTTDCMKGSTIVQEGLLDVPWDTAPKVLGSGSHVDVCMLQKAGLMKSRKGDSRFCSLYVQTAWAVAAPGKSMAQVDNSSFPVVANYEEVFSTVYGTTWRTASATHGFWPRTPDGPWLVRKLLDKLSVTAWGNIPYITRYWKCKQS